METYDISYSLFPAKADSRTSKNNSVHSKKEIFDRAMPLHQVILFANQAAIRKEVVCIQIEKEVSKRRFVRFNMEGIFRKSVNQNRQIIFESNDKKTLHLLPIECILSIQLTSS